MEENNFPYDFTIRVFEYNKALFRVALTPELFASEDGMEFSGNYQGILISEKRGTEVFHLEVDAHTRWSSTPRGMDPGLIDELDKIIKEMRGEIN